MIRIGSLCSGYGGLDLALEALLDDARTTWVSDVDPAACKVLAHRFPEATNIGDMTAVDWTTVDPVDVLTGGTPCQDLSHAGKRAGMTEGTRSNLWVSMREAIATLRPKIVVWENVGGAYSARAASELESREGRLGDGPGRPALRALGRVLGDLASLGYVGAWHGLRAADVGAPHGRLRVFVVAVAADDDRLRGRERLAAGPGEAESGRPFGDAPGRGLLPTPRATDGTKVGPNQRGSSGDLTLPSAVAKMLPTPTARDHKDHTVRREPHRPGDTDTLARALTDVPAALFPTESLLNGQAKSMHGAQWGDYAAAIARWEHILGRPAPAPTMLSAKGKPQLSPVFTEWMMGLPEGWITDIPDIRRNQALRLCGNGVVPQQAAAAVAFAAATILRYEADLTTRGKR